MSGGLKRHYRGGGLVPVRSAFLSACRAVRWGSKRGKPLLLLLPLTAAGIFGALSRAGQAPGEQEIATQEVQAPFKLQAQRNLVVVRVIVRDSRGRSIPGLRKEDFQLFDNGNPQEIDQFSVESSGRTLGVVPATGDQEGEAPVSQGETSTETARNYQALYFDDIEMKFEDIARARDAAERYLASTLTPRDMVGIFTSSGQDNLDFTDDRSMLHDTLFKLRSRPIVSVGSRACPDIGAYQAYLIVEQHDYFATNIATGEASQCQCQAFQGNALQACINDAVQGGATRILNQAQTQFKDVLRGLEQVVRRISVLPGQRSVIFVSPGFLSFGLEFQIAEVTERALRSNVIVSALDPRGLYVVIPSGDAGQPSQVMPKDPALIGRKQQIAMDGLTRAEDVLRNLASDTGGTFFHNSNDLESGFRQVGSLSEVSYVLTFTPRNLKFNGQFHTLKFALVNATGFTIQARRGYFAPKASEDADARAAEEIEQAIYSRADLNELPIDAHTQFYKLDASGAHLAVLTHLGMNSLRFHKEQDRNLNDLTLVTILFDRHGNYVAGKQKRLRFRVHDVTLAKIMQTGITVRTEFDLKPGTYILRQVVRESESGQLSALSRTIEIPD